MSLSAQLRARAELGRSVAFKCDFYALPKPAQDALYGIAGELEHAAAALDASRAQAEEWHSILKVREAECQTLVAQAEALAEFLNLLEGATYPSPNEWLATKELIRQRLAAYRKGLG